MPGLQTRAALVLRGVSLYIGLAGSDADSPAPALQAPEVEPAPSVAAAETVDAGRDRVAVAQADPGRDQGDSESDAGASAPAASAATALPALLEEAQGALASKDWSVAATRAREALQLEPEHAKATEILATAEQEQANAQQYRELEKALKMRDFKKAEARLAALPASSVYVEPARAKIARARDTIRRICAVS